MTDEQDRKRRRPPRTIDVSPALGEAGHETAELGYDGVPDRGPLLHDAGDGSTGGAVEDAVGDVVEHAATRFPPD